MSASDELEQLKCTSCSKYLTVFPIYTGTNKLEVEINLCGRCKKFKGKYGIQFIQSQTLETAVKFVEFPCRYPDCNIKLRWNNLQEHEDACRYRTIVCSICKECYSMNLVESHFKHNHNEFIKKNESIIVIGKDMFYKTYLNIWQNSFYIVAIEPCQSPPDEIKSVLPLPTEYPPLTSAWVTKPKNSPKNDETTAVVAIQNLNCTSSDIYNVIITLKSNNNKLEFHSGAITEDKVEFPFNFSSIFKVFNHNTTNITNFTMEIEICNALKDKVEQELSINFIPQLSLALECPVCTKIMTSSIYICKQGHSICQHCKTRVLVCPICRIRYDEAVRNYALEGIAKTFGHLLGE